MAQLDAHPLFAASAQADQADSFPTVSQGRQRACGAKELDVAAPIAGLQPARRPELCGTDQRALQRNLGSVAELLFAFNEIEIQTSGGESLGTQTRSAANRLSTVVGQWSAEQQRASSTAGLV